MEYVSGPSLRDLLIAEPEGLGVPKAAYFTREIGKGLAYLHDRGIVHRDLKPGNIFFDEGYVKIGDYGLSKFMSVSRHSAQTSSVGTLHYMAPEVGSGNYSRTIDIYALGVMLYEMLLGKVPFEGSSMGEVLMKHLTMQPEVDALPAPFAEVIRKAMAKDPHDRYQTVNAMTEQVLDVDDIRASLAGFSAVSLNAAVARAARVREENAAHRSPAYGTPARALRAPDHGSSARVLPGEAALAMPKESTRRPIAPEALAGSLHYAGFWIRVVAALIDSLVVTMGAGLLLLFGSGNPEGNPLYLAVGVLYEGLLVGRWNGQTLGKKVFGIKVISDDGRVCGQWQAFARALADILNMFTLGLSYLMVAFSDRKRGLHDRIARTVHVYAVE
jgi:uncharacterized RDD family membrane protein YckC